MQVARDIMQTDPPTISSQASVTALARTLLEERLDGLCVVDHSGAFVGIATSMDLIFQEKRPRMPAVFTFLDGVFTFGLYRTKEELSKIAGTTVGDIMTTEPRTVAPDAPLDAIATLMVHEHITVVPVVEHGRLVGVVTKPSVLQAAFLS